jgi:hypothetical protein
MMGLYFHVAHFPFLPTMIKSTPAKHIKCKHSLTPVDIKEALRRIPDREVYPKASSYLTTFPTSNLGSFYIKHPNLTSYGQLDGTKFLSRLLLQEAEILENLRSYQDPNLVRYGCLTNCGRIIQHFKGRLSRR